MEYPESIKIKRCAKAGFFGLSAYPNSVETIGCQLNSKGNYNTGLSPSEQEYFEKELNLKPGELSKNSKYWETFNCETPVRLFNTKTTEINLNTPLNKLKYKILLARTDIASSELDSKLHNKIFYIENPELKAKKQIEAFNFEFEGMKLILSLTPEKAKGALRILGKNGVDLLAPDTVQANLLMEMKADPKKFIEVLTDKELETKIFIYELLDAKLLTRKSNGPIKYGDDTIANSINECVEYFNNVKNQTDRLALETKLKKVKK